MARIKPQDIVDELSSEMRRALEAAVEETIPDAKFDSHTLFKAFKRAVGRKCGTWERVRDSSVEMD